MVKDKVSIIIPTRGGQPYLQYTIDDLLKKAQGDIEIIVVLDGLWPEPPVNPDPRVIVLHHGTVGANEGMKSSINKGILLSQGEYILKTDAHCMWDEGFDIKLKADCEENWVVIPRRYRLNGDEWKIEEYDLINGEFIPHKNARPPIDYMYLAYPYERPFDKTCGLHGAEWRERYYERKDVLIDDTMSFQGSSWFTTRRWFDAIMPKGFDSETFGNFTMEAQEIGNKTWLAGGRLVVNKKTWYAHMHKGKRGKQYYFSNAQYNRFMRENEKGRLAGIDYFLNNRWNDEIGHFIDKGGYDTLIRFEKLLNRFWPVPTWPKNWQEQLVLDEKQDYSHKEGYQGI